MEQIKLQVDHIEFNIPVTDDLFILTPESGEVVTEVDYPEAGRGLDLYAPAKRKSLVKQDGSWQLKEEIGFKTADGVQLPPERTTWHWWVIGCVGALVMILGGYIVFRRIKAHAA